MIHSQCAMCMFIAIILKRAGEQQMKLSAAIYEAIKYSFNRELDARVSIRQICKLLSPGTIPSGLTKRCISGILKIS